MKGRTKPAQQRPKGRPPAAKKPASKPGTGRRTTSVSGLRVTARIVLVAAIFLCPVVVDSGTADPFNLVKVTALWTFGLVAGGLWLIDRIHRGEGIRGSKLGYLALVVLVVNGLAMVFSRNPALSLVGTYKRYSGFASLALYVLILWLLIDLYRERQDRLREVLIAVSWAGGLVAAYAILQEFGLDPVAWRRAAGASLANSISFLGNSQFAGDYIGIAAPAFAYLLFESRGEGRAQGRARPSSSPWTPRLAAAGLVLSVPALFFTQSRSGMLAAVVGVGVLAVLNRDRVPGWTKLGVVGALLLGVVLGVVVLWHPGMERPPAPLDEVQVLRSETVGYRYHWWRSAAEMTLDNPLLGTGPETYHENLPAYRTPEEAGELGFDVSDKPHNIFLEHAVGAGILGLAAYLALVGSAVVWGRRRCAGADPPTRLLLGAFLGLLSAYLAQGLFSIDVPPLALMGWVAVGGIGALADPDVAAEESEKRATFSRPRRGGGPDARKVLGYGVVGVLVVALIVVGVRPLRADNQLKEARRLAARDAPAGEVFGHHVNAIRLHPYDPVYPAFAGDYLRERGDEATDPDEQVRFYEQALELYREAHARQPGNIGYQGRLGNTHMRIAEAGREEHWAEAARWWGRIAEVDPHNWQVNGRYGQVLLAWAEARGEDPDLGCRAIDRFRRAADLHPDAVQVWTELASAHLTLGQIDEARAALERGQAVLPTSARIRRLLTSVEGLEGVQAKVTCPAGRAGS